MEEKKKIGRPKKDQMRGHQIRFGRLSDEVTVILKQFESEKDKQLVIVLLESLKPKK
ncbi:hypothetical protein ACE198_24630 [Neobacillus sp. KR4-4]|uniref:hypothetical protein n=1 Tax=Neobacillus sp. KR4-4 TaxID=3344872 RepID=UPI0035CB0201